MDGKRYVEELADDAHRRSAVEPCYEAKGELGWDHHQGRLWAGFHQYAVTVMLATASCLSVRKLREFLINPVNALPDYRVGGKMLIRHSEFDTWIARYRVMGNIDVNNRISLTKFSRGLLEPESGSQ